MCPWILGWPLNGTKNYFLEFSKSHPLRLFHLGRKPLRRNILKTGKLLEVAQRLQTFTITQIGQFHPFLPDLQPSHWLSMQLIFPFLLQVSTCNKCIADHVAMVNIQFYH